MPNHATTPAPCLKVLIVEDSAPMREILTNIVQAVPALRLTAVAETAAEALAEFEVQRPDVVILDLVLHTGSGLTVLHEIKQRAPACRVLIFTSHDAESYRTCLAGKADQFFSKKHQHQDLVRFLHALGTGGPSRPNSAP